YDAAQLVEGQTQFGRDQLLACNSLGRGQRSVQRSFRQAQAIATAIGCAGGDARFDGNCSQRAADLLSQVGDTCSRDAARSDSGSRGIGLCEVALGPDD